MNNLKLMIEVRARLARNFVDFSRKPGKLMHITAHPKAQIEAAIGDLMVSIPTFRSDYEPFSEIFRKRGRKGRKPGHHRYDDQLVLFLMKYRDNLYLVNTYDYPSYIMQLSDDDWKL